MLHKHKWKIYVDTTCPMWTTEYRVCSVCGLTQKLDEWLWEPKWKTVYKTRTNKWILKEMMDL